MSGNTTLHLLLHCNECVHNWSAVKGNKIVTNYFQMEEKSDAASYVIKKTSHVILSALHFYSFLRVSL
jgi:hypothetical protein